MERRSRLHVERGPGVPQIVPPKALNTRSLESPFPGRVIDPPNRLAAIREHEGVMLADLRPHNLHRFTS
jgi:hypothetical protein